MSPLGSCRTTLDRTEYDVRQFLDLLMLAAFGLLLLAQVCTSLDASTWQCLVSTNLFRRLHCHHHRPAESVTVLLITLGDGLDDTKLIRCKQIMHILFQLMCHLPCSTSRAIYVHRVCWYKSFTYTLCSPPAQVPASDMAPNSVTGSTCSLTAL